MKFILITFFLLFSTLIYSQVTNDSTPNKAALSKALPGSLAESKNTNEINRLNDRLDYQQKLNEQTVSSISNQLSAASYSLTLFGILFTIGAIGIGIYVTYVERKIVKIGEENKELLVKNQKIKVDVEAVNQLIQKDIYGLYIKIKREETIHILERLMIVPKDIANVSKQLLSRELFPEDFAYLKNAYLALSSGSDFYYDYRASYKVLFFQHFFAQTLKDTNLRNEITEFIPTGISAAFENDILKSANDFTHVLIDKGIQDFKLEINQFFKGLSNSDHKNFQPVFQLFFDNLKFRKTHFDFFNLIESESDRRLSKIAFGKLLFEAYLLKDLTGSEKLALEELKNLEMAQQKAEEEAKRKVEEARNAQELKRKQQEERSKGQG